MKRLRDEAAADSATERAARVIVGITPTVPSQARRQRVLAAVEAARSARAGAWRLGYVIPILLILCASAVAGATWGRAWIARAARKSVNPPSAPTTTRSQTPIGAHDHPATPPPQTDVPVLPAPTAVPVATPPLSPPRGLTGRPAVVPRSSSHTVIAASPLDHELPSMTLEEAAGDGAALLIEGLRSLRQKHSPALACERVAEYLRTYSTGSLIEEAFALGIEAERDSPCRGGESYAAEYLRRFPFGRFVTTAQSSIEKVSPAPAH